MCGRWEGGARLGGDRTGGDRTGGKGQVEKKRRDAVGRAGQVGRGKWSRTCGARNVEQDKVRRGMKGSAGGTPKGGHVQKGR